MERGKIKHGSVILCSECFGKYKLLEDLSGYGKQKSNYSDSDMPSFLKDLLDGKGAK